MSPTNGIPRGFCQCGCGARTALIKTHKPKRGLVKGRPRRFLPGHHTRKASVEYIEEDRGYETPCWVWQLGKTSGGYGRKGDGYAHRWFYEQRYGSIPEHREIDHLCRVRDCCNPDHLEVVTQTINTRRGSKAKLSMEAAREIRASSLSAPQLAKLFGVAPTTVAAVRQERTWLEGMV